MTKTIFTKTHIIEIDKFMDKLYVTITDDSNFVIGVLNEVTCNGKNNIRN